MLAKAPKHCALFLGPLPRSNKQTIAGLVVANSGDGATPLVREDTKNQTMSENKLYVGNLSFNTTDDQLAQLFAAHGSVSRASVVTDRETGRSRGFGFVEMGNDQQAQSAIQALDGSMVEGRNLTVNLAKPKENDRGGSRRR